MNNNEIVFSRIVFEITRRCNMNCIHCAKGCSQNISITKEIIDKTLDTIQKNKIYAIDLFGGEPTLEPELIEYVIDGVIKRNIVLAGFEMTTNGTIIDKRISDAFNKMGEYLLEKEGTSLEFRDYVEKEIGKLSAEDRAMENYFKNGCQCCIQVSTYSHNDEEKAHEGYLYYKENANDNVSVHWQTEYKEYVNEKDGKEILYVYMGKAKENYEQLKQERNFRIKDKHGLLRNPLSRLIDVPIYICANGNVVNSSLISYDLEDNPDDYICNILTDNLFEKMDEWNFKYPLNHNQRHYKEWCMTEIFNWKHGVKQIYKKHPEYQLNEDIIAKAHDTLKVFDVIEEVKRKCHKNLPYLTFDEVQFLGDTVLEIFTNGNYFNSLDINGFDAISDNYTYNEKELREAVDGYQIINNKREQELNKSIRDYEMIHKRIKYGV